MRETNNDPRYLRVREQLTEAVLQLAAEKPADRISVSELTRAAGVSRTTFYKHGDSPAQFLADVLIDRVEEYLVRISELMAKPDEQYLLRWRKIYVDMLAYVREYREVVCDVVLGEDQSVLLGLLVNRLARHFSTYVQEFRRHLSGDEVSDLWVEMATSQQVYGFVSILEAWARTRMEERPEVVVNTYLSLAPPWQLARFDSDGTTSLRRMRKVSDLLAGAGGNN